MKSRLTTLGVLTAVLMMIAAIPAAAGGRPLTAEMNGANEVAAGDPDGTGTMHLTLNQGQGEICWDLEVADIQSPARAHIHRAAAGVNGPIVVFFFDLVIPDPIPVAFDGCVGGFDEGLIKDIRQNPENYYINVHNAEYPAGAIRGQLSK
ncbi:MAG: CHRD domain-containing protein [Acidimicrobiia bacterium]|nr:CHRD domain-containing protein [Acidimicrobiia bacterium]